MTSRICPCGARPGPAWAALLLLLPAGLPAAAPPLTLETALERALAGHERAAIAAETSRAARARVGQAWSVLLPSLRLDLGRGEHAGSDSRVSGSSQYDGWELRAGADQTLFDAQALPLVGQARHAKRAAERDEQAERLALSHETASAFLDATSLRQVARAAEERLALARRSLEEIRARHQEGLVGSNDLTRAELEQANAEREWVRARGNAHGGLLRLSALTGPLETDSLAPPAQLLEQSATPAGPVELEAALRLRPDLDAARERRLAARAASWEPWTRWVPDVGVNLDSWTDEDEDYDGLDAHWSWGVNLGWSLFDGGLRLAQAAERKADARAAELRSRWLERQAGVEVELARTALENAQAGLVRAEAALAAARRNSVESTELYRQGLVRALEVTDAAVQLFEAEVERTRAQVGQALAWLELRAAQGLAPLAGSGKENGR